MHHRQIANLQAVTSIFILHGHSLHAYCLGALCLKGGNAMLRRAMKGVEHILLTVVCYVLAGKAPVP